MGFKEKLNAGLKAIQDEAQKQFEKTKEAIENYEPNQLQRKIEDSEKHINKYDDLLLELDVKRKEYEFKKSIAEQEKKYAEQKLKAYKQK